MPQGLSTNEANNLLKQYGLNQLARSSQTEPLKILFKQFTGALSIVLLLFAAVAFFISDIFDSVLIVGIVLINGTVSFLQEFRAAKSIDALKKMVVSEIKVLRDDRQQIINASFLVPGDIIFLEEGNKIPADGTVLESFGLEVDESSLTGESLPIFKSVGDGESGTVSSGTTVTRGHGRVVVTATGMQTRFGQIASLLNSPENQPTPLELQLASLGKALVGVVLVLSTAIFLYGFLNGRELFSILFTSVSLAVAVIPEGLPVVVTVTLAIGVQRMAKRKAIIRKLDSIETLGATNVICTDKTGTLTTNEMKVEHVFFDDVLTDVNKVTKSKSLDKLLQICLLANNTSLVNNNFSSKKELSGDKTEIALLELYTKMGSTDTPILHPGRRTAEFTFDSKLKMMSVIVSDAANHELLTKGAPEMVLAASKHLLLPSGKIRKLTPKDADIISGRINKLAENGERVIGFAFKKLDTKDLKREEAEADLTFVGLVGISDPIREEIAAAVQQAREAGIRTIMITGDNPLTAGAIAKKAGIFTDNHEVITSDRLMRMSDSELIEKLNFVNVFARTTPVDKTRIVKLLQQNGSIVAVTGDGVNDAPALKAANVGVAMAITGTDVAKETADIVLTDDNYSSLISAVEEGRVVYDNIVKALKFLLATNSSELFLVMGTVFMGLPLAITPVQILWINLVTDSLPALALATDPKDPLIMKKLPRERSKSILTFIDPIELLKYGSAIAIVVIFFFLIILQNYPLQVARSISFTLLILLQLGVAFKLRKSQSWRSNQKLLWATFAIIVTQIIILLNPTLRNFFDRV